MSVFGVELTEAQLLITGLMSGLGVVTLFVRWLVSSPERESAAYKQGVSDEQARCEEDVKELRQHALAQAEEIRKLRDGLLRLAIAADLSPTQRSEIAQALGFYRGGKIFNRDDLSGPDQIKTHLEETDDA